MKALSSHYSFGRIICAVFIAFFSATGFCEDEKDAPARQYWTTIERDGQSYVTAANIREFYSFDKFSRNSDSQSAVLRSKSIVLELNSDQKHSEIQVNNVLFALANKTLWDEKTNELLFPTLDLTRLLDPIVRPSFIRNRAKEPPLFFSAEGDAILIEKFNLELLIREVESEGFEVATDAHEGAVTHIKFVFERQHDPLEPNLVSTQSIWMIDKERGNAISLWLATALHAQLATTDALTDGALSLREIEKENPLPANAVITFSLNNSFVFFLEDREKILEALVKVREARDAVK